MNDLYESGVKDLHRDVLAPLVSSLQVDTIGKECMEERKNISISAGTAAAGLESQVRQGHD